MGDHEKIREQWDLISEKSRQSPDGHNIIIEFCDARGIDHLEFAQFCVGISERWLEELAEHHPGGFDMTHVASLICQAFQCGYEVGVKDTVGNPLG